MSGKPPLDACDPPAHPDLEIRDSRAGFQRHLRVDVVRFRNRRFAGGWSGERVFDVVRRGAAVAVLLYDPDRDAVVLVEQFRLAALYSGRSPWQIEAVAGLVEPGETPEAVAHREMREEAAITAIGDLVPIQIMLPACGTLDEKVHLFCARVDSRGAGGIHGVPEEHEDIRVMVKPLSEAAAMLDCGRIESSHTIISLYWLLRHRDRLRREWLGEAPPTSP
ncbi:MAG TPA: NUDIX domain-containing protein [Stellaceae bacterium]|nr:NUDIX domain-containing protein [Stellaceae bacterium]